MTKKRSAQKRKAPPAVSVKGLADQMLGRSEPTGLTPVRVCVGLDFGTSTTKAVVYATMGRTQQRWAPKIHGHEHYPSVLVERGIGVSFGPSDVQKSRAKVHRSMKMLLRAAALEGDEDRLLHGSRLPVHAAVWGYLVHVIQDIEATIAARFPSDRFHIQTKEWHLGVPLDEKQASIERAFRRVFFRALRRPTDSHVDRLVWRDDLIAAYQRVSSLDPPPMHERSDCFVYAEAAVAVNAIRLIGRPLETGKYFVCDVGAGTTDTAFFWYSTRSLEEPIQFYATSCPQSGGDMFVSAVKDKLRAGEGRTWDDQLLHASATERLHGGEFTGSEPLFRHVLKRMDQSRRTAFGRARDAGETLDRWQSVTGYLVGGGSRMPGVERTCLSPLPTGVGKNVIPVTQRTFSLDELEEAVEGMTDLHWIAAGLSIPAEEFEDYGVLLNGESLLGNQGREREQVSYDDRYPK